MSKTSNLLLCCLAFSLPLLARDKTDVVYLKNGDRFTCEIRGLSSGILYVKAHAILGTQSVEWAEVARLESGQLFIVKTEDGSSYQGTLSTAVEGGARPLEIAVVDQGVEKQALNAPEVVEMAQTSETFWPRLNGSVSFGVIYAKGNQTTQYSLASDVEYPRERWAAAASMSSTLSSSTGASASTRNNASVALQRLLPWNNWFYAGEGNFLQSSEQGIALQTTVGGGIGRYLKNSNRTRISLLGGLGWQNINYQQTGTNPQQENVAAAFLAAKVKFYSFNKTEFDLTTLVLPALSEPGRVHVNMTTAYYIKLFSNLTWNISFYGNWDNQPPPGFSTSDYGTSSGLGWTFGNR